MLKPKDNKTKSHLRNEARNMLINEHIYSMKRMSGIKFAFSILVGALIMSMILGFPFMPVAGQTETDMWKVMDVETDDSSYKIAYQIISGKLESISADVPAKALIIVINSTGATSESGQLIIELPRWIIDARQADNMTDANYVVHVGRLTPQYGVETVDFQETRKSEILRRLQINYPVYDDANTLVIINGTHFVPEFGGFAFVLLGISITGIIIITARHYRKSGF